MSRPTHYKRIVLNKRPVTYIEPDTFRTETVPFDLKPSNGEVLVQVTWLSLDPAVRGYIRDVPTYIPPVQIGAVINGHGLGVVIESGTGSKFAVGDFVSGRWGWTEFAVMEDKDVQKIEVPKGVEALDFINTLNLSGLTAYFGLKDIGKLKAGETLLVSGAAGSVGSHVCQLGKQAGAKVFATVGSQEKCEWLEKELGVDMAFNYKSPSFKDDIKKIGYIDVFFDNVGGEILDIVVKRLNKHARIVLCGGVSQYNAVSSPSLPNYMVLISQRAKIEGFIVHDYAAQFPAAIQELAAGIINGTIKRKFHIVEGLEQAPVAVPLLFSGGNMGKLVVKVSEYP